MIPLDKAFFCIGIAVVLKSLYDFASFLAFHSSAPSVHRYLYGKAPYAIVTGATDGIGKSTAKELYKRGFNIILHGRNPDKLRLVQNELKTLGSNEVKIWVEDVCRDNIDFAKAISQWEGMEITLVVHNVGGSAFRAERIDGLPENVVLDDLKRNAIFPLLFTRAILPKLRAASGPAAMIYLSSIAGTNDPPRLAAYGATKAFIIRLSGCLGMDERYWVPTNVETCAIVIGSVVSAGHPVREELLSPSSDTYAKAMVDRFGCGRKIVIPYWPHALQMWAWGLLPQGLLENLMSRWVKEEVQAREK